MKREAMNHDDDKQEPEGNGVDRPHGDSFALTCQDVQSQLVLLVLNELSASETQEIDRHLASGCSDCNCQLQELCEGVDLLFEVAPESSVSQERFAAILARANVPPNERASSVADGTTSKLTASTATASRANTERAPVSKVDASLENASNNSSWSSRLSTLLIGVASLAAGVCLAAWLFPNPIVDSKQNDLAHSSTSSELDSTQVEDGVRGTNSLAAGDGRELDQSNDNGNVRLNVERMLLPTHSSGSAFGYVPQDQRASKLSQAVQRFMLVSSDVGGQKIDGQVIAVGDQITRQLHVFGSGLSQPPEEMDYVLFGDSPQGAVVLATVLLSDEGTFQTVVNLPPVPLDGIFLKLEPSR